MTIPKYLYHYTSQKGLLGILQTKKLRMTNILYLNDSSEFSHTFDLVMSELTTHKERLLNKKGLLELMEDKGIDGDIFRRYEYVERILKGFLSDDNRKTETYVFSLSQKGDDLSQWRGYCPKEGGFSIGFDSDKLLSIIENSKSMFHTEKCIYDLDIQKDEISSMFDDIHNYNNFMDILLDIIVMSSHYKHDKFKDEREFRIIHYGTSDERKYREGNSMIIPYIEGNLLGEDGKLPISKIIAGPTPHKELSKVSVDSLLKSIGYEDVDVESSEIPYSSW